jgi:hypothetical protein
MRHLKIKRVRALGVWIPVFYAPADSDSDLQGQAGVLCHPTDGRASFIKIDSRLGLNEQRESLWHEVTHCADIETSGTGRCDLPEKVTGRLARCQYAIMRDNPAMMAVLCEQDE